MADAKVSEDAGVWNREGKAFANEGQRSLRAGDGHGRKSCALTAYMCSPLPSPPPSLPRPRPRPLRPSAPPCPLRPSAPPCPLRPFAPALIRIPSPD